MNFVFWPVVALDVLVMLGLTASALGSGQNDGGREMAIAFFVVLPALLLGLMVLLYLLAPGLGWRLLATGVSALPLAAVLVARLRAL